MANVSNEESKKFTKECVVSALKNLLKEKAYDDITIDISYVYEKAQIMISNSLETSVISVSKMGD